MVAGVGVGLAGLAACCLAGQALTIRMATQRGQINHALLVVLVTNVVVLIPLALVFDPSPTITTRSLLAFAAAGVMGTILGRAFFYAGIERIGASRADPIKASMPIFATLFAVLFLGEHVTGAQIVGIVLVVSGIAVISWEGSAQDRIAGNDVPWIGLTITLAAAVISGLEPVFATYGFREGTSPIVGLGIKSIVAFGIFVSYLVWRDAIPSASDLPADIVKWYVLAGLANTSFLMLYYVGLTFTRVGVFVPIMQMSPLIVVLVSALFLGKVETVTPRLAAAAVVIVSGAVTITVTG